MEEMIKELTHSMNRFEMFRIPLPTKLPLLGDYISVTNTVVLMWIIMGILIILSLWLTSNLKPVPDRKQNFIEIIVSLINNMVKDTVGHHWRDFAPYLGSILFFLFVSNIISIFNVIPKLDFLKFINDENGNLVAETSKHSVEQFFHLVPPTKDINVTAAMAIMTIVIVIGAGIKYKGFFGFLKSFIKPLPFMLPFNILDYIIKPLSLCLRLFGNILAAFAIMEMLYMAIPPVIPAALGIYFDLFDGVLQAYIFVFLTSLYIGEAVEEHH